MNVDAGLLREALDGRLLRRGWRFREEGAVVNGRVQDWPHQMFLLVDPGGSDRPACLGLALNFDGMPLGGERFRDILNADREEMLYSYGNFRLRQLLKDGSWGAEVGHRSFLHGYGSGSGITRRTALAIFDRCPSERGLGLVERVVADLPRIAETGAAFAAGLQRVYQRIVLTGDGPSRDLPDVVGSAAPPPSAIFAPRPADAEPSYPWRR